MSFNTVPPSPQAAGTTVLATAAASGCASPEYRWWILPPGGAWTLAQDWGAAGFSWSTSGLAAGTYELNVWARAAGSATTYDSYAQQPYALSGP